MKNILIIASILTTVMAGCDRNQAMPEVNNENCQTAKIMQIKDEATRQEFGKICSRRLAQPNSLPSNPKRW